MDFDGDASVAEKRYGVWESRIRERAAIEAAKRKSSTKEPEEAAAGASADVDIEMAAAEPDASASIRVKKRKVPVKVRCGPMLVLWRVLMV